MEKPLRKHPDETPEQKKERIRLNNNEMARRQREYIKTMSPDERAEYESNKRFKKEQRERERAEKAREKQQKLDNARELAILEYMRRSITLYYHHGYSDNLHKDIEKAIEMVKEENTHLVYHPYVWNHYGEGNNYMSISLLGKLWRHPEFKTIYDVPLDGTQIFYGYDSGERGTGSFHRISAHPAGELPDITKPETGRIFGQVLP